MTHFEINCTRESFNEWLVFKYIERAGLKKATPEVEELCARLSGWLYGEHRRFNSLLIQGVPGTGKTTLVEAIRNTIRTLSIEFNITSNLTMRVPATLLENEERLADGLIEHLVDARGLILDDLGHENPIVKVWGRDYHPAESILKQRSDKQIPTIVTTNLSLKEIESYYNSPRLADVLAQYDKLQIESKTSFRRIQ